MGRCVRLRALAHSNGALFVPAAIRVTGCGFTFLGLITGRPLMPAVTAEGIMRLAVKGCHFMSFFHVCRAGVLLLLPLPPTPPHTRSPFCLHYRWHSFFFFPLRPNAARICAFVCSLAALAENFHYTDERCGVGCRRMALRPCMRTRPVSSGFVEPA